MFTQFSAYTHHDLRLLTLAADSATFATAALTQSSETGNRVTLLPTDSDVVKIQKAAHVRPSAR